MLSEPWRIQLLGELRALRPNQVITRFYTHKIGSLLAYLACFRSRSHPREELIGRFWPDADLDAGRMSLRTALASLRRQLEPPGIPAGSVLSADRFAVRLNGDNVTTDVAEFESALTMAGRAETPEKRVHFLAQAVSLYSGDLLPGYYDDWALHERSRLAEVYKTILLQLSQAWETQGHPARALVYARRAVERDQLDEEAQAQLIRLYASLGQDSHARRQYEEMERTLRKELDVAPHQSFWEMIHGVSPLPDNSAPPSHPPTKASPDLAELPPLSAPAEPPSAPLTATHLPPLPTPLTPFFGREEEIARLHTLLTIPGVRVITLTGLGGTGKTRLALELARQIRQAGTREVFFISLIDLTDAHRLAETIRDGLRLEGGNNDPNKQVREFLKDRECLLVLDNFEQILEEGYRTVRALLETCPQSTFLITSRLPLNLAGEWEFAVTPLPTPTAPVAPERLMEFASVRLFVHRAQSARPDFQLTSGNVQAVANLCRSLEGIPLALELAAARAQVLTPAQMMQHVTDRFQFLVGRQRDTAQRHRTLRAVLDWSYQALSASQQWFLSQLSVFRGGWSLAAAEAVCEEPFALDFLMDIRQASLIVTEEQGDEMRFRMLETVRAFAQERLTESGRTDLARKRHRDYFLHLAEQARKERVGQRQTFWLERLETEHDNLRSALDFCQEEADSAEAGLLLVSALDWFWDFRGHFAAGWERTMAALAHPGAQQPTVARAAALTGAGMFAEMRGDYATARALFGESLEIMRALGDKMGIASALGCLGSLARTQGDYRASRSLFEEALGLWSELENEEAIVTMQTNLGLIARDQGDYTTARALLEKSLGWMRAAENRQGIAVLLTNLGGVEIAQGNREAAYALFTEGLAMHREQKNPWGMAGAMQNLALAARHQGKYEEAFALFEESLILIRALGDKQGTAAVLDNLGLLSSLTGKINDAWAFLGESLALRGQMRDAYGLIGTLHTASLVLERAGQPEQAVTLWAAAAGLRDALGGIVWPVMQNDLNLQLEALQRSTDPAAFASEWETGSAMRWEEAWKTASALVENARLLSSC